MHLSTKEVNYIKDLLSWELLASKKCYNYANGIQDYRLAQLFDEAGRIHQQNFTDLLNYVNNVSREV